MKHYYKTNYIVLPLRYYNHWISNSIWFKLIFRFPISIFIIIYQNNSLDRGLIFFALFTKGKIIVGTSINISKL